MGVALPSPVRPRIGQFVRLLASDRDGEVIAAVRAIGRTLKGVGADFHDLAEAVEREPAQSSAPHSREPGTFAELARWCRDNDRGRLAAHERTFVADMTNRLVLSGRPTEKQAAWLRQLYAKLGGAGGW